MRMEMVQAKELIYEYEKRDEEGNVIGMSRAIDGVDLDVLPGQFVAILGHNGSGKSTLAKQINAILVPSGGTMWVDGRDTRDPDELWNVRQSAGMVFQNPDNQIIGTVVEEDVGFGPENLGVPTDEIWTRVEESLKAVGMIEYRSHSPNKLSGGQKQRVAIAGVIAMEPKCIVLADGDARSERTERCDPHGAGTAEKETGDGDPDHALYGRGDRRRPGVCHGSWTCCDGRNTAGNLFAGGRAEAVWNGCAAGDYAGGGASETWVGSAAGDPAQ